MASPKDNVSMSALGQLYDAVWAVSEDQVKKTGKAPDFVVSEVSDYVAQGIAEMAGTMTGMGAAASGVDKMMTDYAGQKFGPPKIAITDIFPTHAVSLPNNGSAPMTPEDQSVAGRNDNSPGTKAEAKLEVTVNDLITNPRAVADKAAEKYINDLKEIQKAKMIAGAGRAVQEGLNYLQMSSAGVPSDIAATAVNAKVWDNSSPDHFKEQETMTSPSKVRLGGQEEVAGKMKDIVLTRSEKGGSDIDSVTTPQEAYYAKPSDRSIFDVFKDPKGLAKEVAADLRSGDAFAKLDADQLADRRAELARARMDAVMANSMAMRAGITDAAERREMADLIQSRLMGEFVKEYNAEATASTVLRKSLDPTRFADSAGEKLYTPVKGFYDIFNLRTDDGKNFFATTPAGDIFDASKKGEAPGHVLQRAMSNALGTIRKDPSLTPAQLRHLDSMMYQLVDENDLHSFFSSIGKSLEGSSGGTTVKKMGMGPLSRAPGDAGPKDPHQRKFDNSFEGRNGITPKDLTFVVQDGMTRLAQQASAEGNSRLANGLLSSAPKVGQFDGRVDSAIYMMGRWNQLTPINQLLTPAMLFMGDANGFKNLVNTAGGITGAGPISGVPWDQINVLKMFGGSAADMYKLTPDKFADVKFNNGSVIGVKNAVGSEIFGGGGVIRSAEKGAGGPGGIMNFAYRKKVDAKDKDGNFILGADGKKVQVWDTTAKNVQFGSPGWIVSGNANGVQKFAYQAYVYHPVNQIKGRLNGSFYQHEMWIASDYGKAWDRLGSTINPTTGKPDFLNKDLRDTFKNDKFHAAFMKQHDLKDAKGAADARKSLMDVKNDLLSKIKALESKGSLTAEEFQRLKDLKGALKVFGHLDILSNPKYRAIVEGWEKFNKIVGLPGALQKKAIEWLKEQAMKKLWEEGIKQLLIKLGLEATAQAIGAILTGGVSEVIIIAYTVIDFVTLGLLSKIVGGAIKFTFEFIMAIILFIVAMIVFGYSLASGGIGVIVGVAGSVDLATYSTFFGLGSAALWAPDPNYIPPLKAVGLPYGGPGGGPVPSPSPIDWSQYQQFSNNSCPIQIASTGASVTNCSQGPNGTWSHHGRTCPSGNPCNYAIDMAPGDVATQIVAPTGGTAVAAGIGCSGGTVIGITFTADDGVVYKFYHVNIKPDIAGKHVAQGTVIGAMIVGPSLCSTGSHVHFEVWRNGKNDENPDAAYGEMCGMSGWTCRP